MVARDRRVAAWQAALALVFACASWARAAEYFVARTGGDAGDGLSETTAWSTVAKGIAALKPGDTLTILPGQYFESVAARVSGAPGAPITIRARTPGSVVLRGDVDVAGFKPLEGMRYVFWVDFDRRVEGVADRADRRLYDPALSVQEVEQSLAAFYQDPKTRRLYVHTGDSKPADWKALSVSVASASGLYLPPSSHDIIVDGIEFTGYNTLDLPPEPGSRNRWGIYVDAGSERIVIRRCAAYLNSGGVSLLAASDAVVEDCRAFGNTSRFNGGLATHIIAWSGHNVTFRRNNVEGTLTFYGGDRADKKPLSGLMEHNICNGVFIKGSFTREGTLDRNNCVVGRGAAFFRLDVDPTNLLLPDNEGSAALRGYADPVAHDYRLQSDAPQRGKGPEGRDPGPFPYRGEVFFVSPKGNDAKDGTSLALAWKTLAHAARRARAGHTVYVTEGVYSESLAPANSGAADQPIQFLRRGRDQVVLDGGGRLPTGVDLTGRSNIHVRGFTIRNFTRDGVEARDGQGLRIEQVTVTDCGGAGVAVHGVKDFALSRSLLRANKAGGLRLERTAPCGALGNIFDRSGGPGLGCDPESLRGLRSDFNAFPPSAQPNAAVDGKPLATLADWRAASGQDANSVAVEPGYRDAEAGDLSLREGSPLIGRGPLAWPVGPYLRVPLRTPVPVENLAAKAVTATTAVIECWTPVARSAISLEWGAGQQVEAPAHLPEMPFAPGLFQTVGLTGLKPGAEYTVRVRSKGTGEGCLWAAWAAPQATPPAEAAPASEVRFRTLAQDPAPRELHVAVTGDDLNSGASLKEAWRTVSHAAIQARAGDTVLIHEGSYEEQVLVRVTGDKGRPVTFRAAPGETVWLDGSDRLRSTAFRLDAKSHVHLDGLRFRHFNYLPHIGASVVIEGGAGNVVRRCFNDGRERNGYTDIFLRARNTENLLVENCVAINGMGPGISLTRCFNATVRHCVFYNNFIYAVDAPDNPMAPWDSRAFTTFSHNLFCDTIPTKTNNPFFRAWHLEALRSDHNVFFARKGPDERKMTEAASFRNKRLGQLGKGGGWDGEKFLVEEIRKMTGQEKNSVFGNPGIRAAKNLEPPGRQSAEWRKNEMHWNEEAKAFDPLDFADFFADPGSPAGKAADGRPIGLDPGAFGRP